LKYLNNIVRFLIHGSYIKNDLHIKNKNKLELDYDDTSNRFINTFNISSEEEVITTNKVLCSKNNLTAEFIFKLTSEDYIYIPYQHIPSVKTTTLIPNLIDKSSFEKDNNLEDQEEPSIFDFIEDFLYVLVPIMVVVFIIILIIKCKKTRIRRIRMPMNISHLKTTPTPIRTVNYDELNESTSSSSIIINSLV
jgi:hypothetical protein